MPAIFAKKALARADPSRSKGENDGFSPAQQADHRFLDLRIRPQKLLRAEVAAVLLVRYERSTEMEFRDASELVNRHVDAWLEAFFRPLD